MSEQLISEFKYLLGESKSKVSMNEAKNVIGLPKKPSNSDIKKVIDDATESFWQVVANSKIGKDAVAGDLDPLALSTFEKSVETIVKRWFEINHPGFWSDKDRQAYLNKKNKK